MLIGMVDICVLFYLYKVVDVIVYLLMLRYFKIRYMVGWDVKFFWIWVFRFLVGVGDVILNFLGDKVEFIVCIGVVMWLCKSLGKLNGNNNLEKVFVFRK